MRDPGTPGRNPFFDHGPDAELGDLANLTDDLDGATFAPGGYDAPGFDAAGFDALGFGPDGPAGFSAGSDPWSAVRGADPLGTLAALVDALQGAQPEATEHLVAAAHELVLAVKSVVDATEAVLAAQRAGAPTSGRPGHEVPRHEAPAEHHDADEPARDPFTSDQPPTSSRTSGVRRIDLA